MSVSFLRAVQPCLLTRMVNQVGSPAMLEGKRLLPVTGTPMRKMLRSRTALADCDPEPFTVATWMEKSLTICFTPLAMSDVGWPCTSRSLGIIYECIPLNSL